MGLFDRMKPAAKKGKAESGTVPSPTETQTDDPPADPEVLVDDDKASPNLETALVPVEKPRTKRSRRPRVLRPNTGGDVSANPINVNEPFPKLKLIKTGNGSLEQGYQLIERVLQERDGGIARAMWRSVRHMSQKRVAAVGILGGFVGTVAFSLLGPIGFLLIPTAIVADRAQEARRVRQGRRSEPHRVSERESLSASPALLALATQSKDALPWELRCQWLLAAWRLQNLIRNYNMRAEIVNSALKDATLSSSEHGAALRMGELLCKVYPRLEKVRRFLEEDLYSTRPGRPLSEMVQYDAVISSSDPFGYRDARSAPVDWLILPHHVFTRKQLVDQLHVDLETIAGMRVGIREAGMDEVDLEIERLEKVERTGKRKKLPPPTDE